MKLAVPVPSLVLVDKATVGAVAVFHTTPFDVMLEPERVCPPLEALLLVMVLAATVVVTVAGRFTLRIN